MSQLDRTITSRYEWKYFVPPALLPSIRALARAFVRPDAFARKWPGNRYPIVSLYLDGDGLELYRTTVEGHRNRFKLRVRAYDDDPASPVFLEIKKRSNVVVRKTRARVSRATALRLLAGRGPGGETGDGLAEFALRFREVQARPLVRVRYMREAYESLHGDPVRLTFDTDIEYRVTRTADLALRSQDTWERTPAEGAVVELKFANRCPSWGTQLIDRLELVRESIPKYVLSMDRAFEKGQLDVGAQAQQRLSAPPLWRNTIA